MPPVKLPPTTQTRDRLVTAALDLFAERGFRATTVGDIEAAAGLVPRRGALYNHFGSKEALLEAAVDRHVADLAGVEALLVAGPLAADLRTELTWLARWVLAERARERRLLRIMQREADTFPQIAALIHDRIVEPGYRQAAAWVRARITAGGFEEYDADAVAVVALGSLAAYALQRETFGHPLLGVDEDRLVDTWVEVWLRVARSAEAERDAGYETDGSRA